MQAPLYLVCVGAAAFDWRAEAETAPVRSVVTETVWLLDACLVSFQPVSLDRCYRSGFDPVLNTWLTAVY